MPTIIKGDATVGGANSYGDVAGFRAHWAKKDAVDRTVAVVPDVSIETWLIEATEWIDALPFFGVPLDHDGDITTPWLNTPRRGLVVGNASTTIPVGTLLPEDSNPYTIEAATYELAEERRLEDCPLTRQTVKDRQALRSRTSEGLGRVWVDELAQRRYPRVENLLAGLYCPPNTIHMPPP